MKCGMSGGNVRRREWAAREGPMRNEYQRGETDQAFGRRSGGRSARRAQATSDQASTSGSSAISRAASETHHNANAGR